MGEQSRASACSSAQVLRVPDMSGHAIDTDIPTRPAAVAERARLAREMHDVLAHTLTGLVVQLDGARLLARSRHDGELAEIVQRAHGLTRDGARRGSAGDLRAAR